MSFPTAEVSPIFSGWEQQAIDIGDDGLLLEIAAKVQILRHLDEECDRQEEFWAHRMQSLAPHMPQTRLASPRILRVDPRNVFTGARPSLLQAPIDFWPSITVRCGDLRPDRAQSDQYDTFACDLYVEVMSYAGPVARERLHLQEGIDTEGAANVQVHLLSCAAQMCVRRDPSLGGLIMPIQQPPVIRAAMPHAVPGVDGERAGDWYVYHGRQHLYSVTRNSF